MRLPGFPLWWLVVMAGSSTASTASTLETRTTDHYEHRPLDETIEDLGLQQIVADIPDMEQARYPLSRRCEIACHLLSIALPSAVQFPGSDSYIHNQGSYWAKQQTDRSPSCFVAVKDAFSISVCLTISQKMQCPFSVRSGGHSPVPGASNVKSGIAIDLRTMNDITLSHDKQTAYIGAGATWGDVYSHLDELGLMVVGGRVPSIGVGGLILGGGISFISGTKGFACDNVVNYQAKQVILADGRLRNVNQTSHPDLYRVLRGGGNNFGIVTRFDLDTYPEGEMWTTMRSYHFSAKEHITAALEFFNDNATNDPNLSIITSFSFVKGHWVCGYIVHYADPVPNPDIFRSSFKQLENVTALEESSRIARLLNLVTEMEAINPPAGLRELFLTATYKNSAELQNKIIDSIVSEVDFIKESVRDADLFRAAVNFQAITSPMISNFSRRGGNIVGVHPNDGPLLVFLIAFTWESALDDSIVVSASQSILSKSKAIAAEMGLLSDFIYMNYAGARQSPIASYGKDNLHRMREVQRKYDPNLVFEKLQPGGFKLRRAMWLVL
ncbi:hypothetical protein AJ79_07018 [Helicocarpus griseus UAMH5409]|uniref:FAD-binding PCMH-type domain-containing protein n=1 Tax=Helicocarpus griseus UAMH5409 TaxID=1447875 RepID=A0A2B7X753_9EURO|nr:hypothetical protein AJ79_07018 [Helicocarpus griseus UAMH5409]